MSSHSRKSKRLYGAPKAVPLQAKSPSAFLGKETVPQGAARPIQAIENVYEFFTKQRPLAWTYLNTVLYEPLLTTGSAFESSIPTVTLVKDLDVNECLILSHFEVSIQYRPIPEGTAVADIQNGYYVALDSPSIPPSLSTGTMVGNQVGFVFNLRAQEASLYEASNIVRGRNYAGFRRDGTVPQSGFVRLNTNVLANAENSTSIYIFESGPVTVDYTCIDSSSGSGNVPRGFFPYGLEWTIPLADLRIGPIVMYDIRGFVINKNDAELLKTLVQNN